MTVGPEYVRDRLEVYDPSTGEWVPVRVRSVVTTRARRISNVSGMQRLGSYRVGPGSFMQITSFELSGDRTFEWEIRDNRGSVGLGVLPGGGPYNPRPDDPRSIYRHALQGTVQVFVRDAATGGTYDLTMDFELKSTAGPGTANLLRA